MGASRKSRNSSRGLKALFCFVFLIFCFWVICPLIFLCVYQVNIDAEQQRVTVSGSLDSATLIKKLVRSGKHAELWSPKGNQNQKQKANRVKDEQSNKGGGQKQGLAKGLEVFKNQQQQKFPAFISEDYDDEYDYFDDDDEEEDDDDVYGQEELRFLREKVNQLGLLRQQQVAMEEHKKGVMAAAIAAGASNNSKVNNNGGNGNVGKKGGNPNHQDMGSIDQKTMAAAMKMKNSHLGGGNHDISSMMGLAGFHGNGGGNSNGMGASGGFQVQPTTGGLATVHHQPQPPPPPPPSSSPSMVMNMNGYQQYNHPAASSMMMNLHNRQQQQQPQPPPPPPQAQMMMYQRSPYIPPTTGYYYNNNIGSVLPIPYTCTSSEPTYNTNDHSSAAHMFSDENTNSCSIM
ncbi:hypothetical protein U1Q18_002181 [Sarracenia purpurea var. burkii]